MTLQFNPAPYLEVWRQKRAEDEANRPNFERDVSQPFRDTLSTLMEFKRQRTLDNLAKKQDAREQQKFEYQYGKPSSEADTYSEGERPIGLFSQSTPIMDRFNEYMKGQKMKPRPVTPENMGSLRRAEMREDLKLKNTMQQKELDRMRESYTPEQLEAIGLDPTMADAWGTKTVPQKAANLASLAQNRSDLSENRRFRRDFAEEEQGLKRDERTKGRYRQYVLDMEQRDPVIKQLRKEQIGISQVGRLIDIVKDGNTVAANALGVKMARGMGEVGVLTESDITRYITSGQLSRSAGDKLNKMILGRPTDASLNELQEITNVLEQTFNERIQPRYDQYIESYAQIEQMKPDELANALSLDYSGSRRRGNDSSNNDPLGIR